MAEMQTLKIEVMRYNPESDAEPHFVTYAVPYDEQTSLLDALGYIKDNLAPDLSYRWSCRMAICGSCGMMVNRVPKLACKTFLRDYVDGMKVEALGNFPIERDLVVDMTHFIESLEAIKPYIIGNDRKPEDGPNVQTPGADGQVSPVLRLHQLRPVLRRVPAVRPQPRVYRPGGDHAGAPLQPGQPRSRQETAHAAA